MMPFDLTNAPTTFMDLMHLVFRPYLDQFVVIFMDDILVYSKNLEEHERHLRIVLKEHKLYAKFRKCEFWLEKVSILGHIIFKDGIIIDSVKVEVVAEWKWLENSMEVRNFLGLGGYY